LAVSATVFEILILKARKWLNFPTPALFEPPLGGNPLKCRDEIWHHGLPEGEQIMTLAFFILTQYRRVTDGRTNTWLSQRPALAYRAGKNLTVVQDDVLIGDFTITGLIDNILSVFVFVYSFSGGWY